jgi:hypothetical protein
MWSGAYRALAFAAWVTLSACSGGYPLPPTRCDELCEATKGDTCQEFYDPAGCVAGCERGKDAPAECRAQLDVVIGCFHEHPEALEERCSFNLAAPPACTDERTQLVACAHPEVFPGGNVPGDGGGIGGNCTLESLHLQVGGGASFDHQREPQDACRGELGDHEQVSLTFFVNPPELEDTLFITAVWHGIPAGTTGSFTPDLFSLATPEVIWSSNSSAAEQPVACSASLAQFEPVPPGSWRIAGALSCPAALPGIGAVGVSPLTILDFRFGMLFSAAQ